MLVKEESLCFERYEYKIKKGLLYKKIVMSIQIYPSSVSGCALPYMGDGLGSDTVNFDVGYEKLLAVKLAAIDSVSCMILEISGDGVVSNSVDVYVFPKLKDMEAIYSLLMKTKEEWHNRILQEEKEKRQLWQAKEQERAEVRKAQEKFFNDCYHFHDTNRKGPFYVLSQNELQFAGIYIDKQNNLNFLRIDGEAQQESNGVIPSNKIHYFEKAGNVHYTTDINGNYSNFGGSLTGGTFSKKAAFWGGLLLGKMGMEGGALFSHKPMESTMPETHISIKSEVKKIDDRNVVLNYYSDVLETYIDMELPADTYNFLQTYIPDKKYSIVLELEKQSAVQQHKEQIESGMYLNKPEPEARIEAKKDEIDDVLAKIKKVAELKDLGILTEEEFAAKKAELLSKI